MRTLPYRFASIGRAAWSARVLAALLVPLLLGMAPENAAAQPGTITTVAGGGSAVPGDGGPATLAALSGLYGVAVDSAGNIYIPEYGNNRVRKVSAATGIITTLAGTGVAGSTGDGGPATLAQINAPIYATVDTSGNVYFSEYHGFRVRKIDAASGVITTVAGTGTQGYNGDGIPATTAQLSYPWGLAVSPSGNLFIADHGNCRIRMVWPSTGEIYTAVGTGACGNSGDGGPATAATISVPLGMVFDAADNLYFVDYSYGVVRKAGPGGTLITRVAGTGSNSSTLGDGGPATAAGLNQPYDVSVDAAGNLYIADASNNRVRVVNMATGIIATFAGSGAYGAGGDGGPATQAQFGMPLGLAVGPAGELYIADNGNQRIRMVEARTLPVITWANPAGITYGTALSATQLNATANVPGTFAYDPASGTVLGAGAGQVLSTTFTPDDTLTYAPVTTTVTIDVAKATPVITWTSPAPITAGTALSATQLNATANVAGTFAYTPPAGTVLAAGAGQVLSVLFTPTDAANYDEAARQVTIDVTPAGPVNGPPYTLTVTKPTGGTITGAGIVCGAGGSACAVTMPAAMTLGLSAAASSGYTFTNWTGDCTGTTTSQWVNLQGPRTCGAVFTQVIQTYSLTISPVPTGGTVTGGGLTCGTGGATCAVTFGSSTTASLTATPDTGYVFAGWGGACSGTGSGTSVTVNAAKTCSATFTAAGGGASGPPYTLTVTKPTGGTITGAGINCGAAGNACSVTMPAAMTLGLAAAASSGYTFTAWTGDCTGTAASQWVNLQGPRTCGATFTATGGGTPAGSGIITTFAGTGLGQFGGDGGPATAADLWNPTAMVVDAAGNVYIADGENQRIRKVAAGTGIITTVAGTGTAGFSGDGGPATAAQFNLPYGLALDGAGNLYVGDYYNHRVRMVSAATGLITTVVGNGTTTYNGDDIPATAAAIYYPFAIAADSNGNLYVGENEGHRLRKVSAATGLISTLAGTGSEGYGGDGGPATAAAISSPYGIEVDDSGNVYFTDLYNQRVRKVDAATGVITTVAGTGAGGYSGDGGPATAAALDYPLGLAFDSAGNLLIAEYNNHRVRSVAAGTGIITTIAGTGTSGFSGDGGPATAAQLGYPYGLAVDGSGNLYVADLSNQRVRKVGGGPAVPPDGAPYTLTITPPTGGKIQGAGINCGAGGTACSVTMPAQMTLGLAATPSAGYTFGGWTGHCSGASPALWLDLKGARTCSATFTAR